MKDLEAKLTDLETRHSDLSKSYDSLQVEYSSVKQELERLTREKMKEDASQHGQLSDDWDICRTDSLDPLLFDVTTFCYDHGETEDRK
jgi:predicted nuclease with TOPRIM domain